MANLLAEIRRRNVARVAIAYIAAAWLIVQVVETILPAFGVGAVAVRTLVVLLAIGFLPALILTWVFELTPDGLRRDRNVDDGDATARYTGKGFDRAIIIVLMLAVMTFAFDKFIVDPARDAERERLIQEQARSEAMLDAFSFRSIAVLPFVNRSADEDQEYFSQGISEEILNLLAEIRELRVISRSSSFSFKDRTVDIPTIAEQLNVSHILDGSVRRSGERIRITAQLIDARSDTQLWSQSYERGIEDVFATQEEIAREVVSNLEIELHRADRFRIRHTDPKAYELQLRARYIRRQENREAFESAINLYKEALAIDPDYPLALEGLAEAYVYQAMYGFRSMDESFSLASEAINRALVIDPQFGMGVAGLGFIAFFYEQDLVAAARYFKRAYELDPTNLEIISGVAVFAEAIGDIDTSIAFEEYSVSRDPLGPIGHVDLAYSYLKAERYDDAIRSVRAGLSLKPDRLGARTLLGLALLLKGDVDAAVREIENEPSEASRLNGLALLYSLQGDLEQAEPYLQALIRGHATTATVQIAGIFAARGDADQAFEWLEKARDYRDPGLALVIENAWFEGLHDDPRWQAFLETLGRSSAQLSEIDFDVGLPK